MNSDLKILSFFLCLIVVAPAVAQEQRSWEELWSQWSTAEDIDSEGWEDTFEMLTDLEESPLDINTATREQLEQLPFLSSQQVEDIQEYIYRYGSMKSTGELAMIPSIDYTTRALLSHFIVCGEKTTANRLDWSKALRYGQHELMATGSIPFYERRGDNGAFLGYPYRHSLRYKFTYRDQLKVGFLGAQDAGEPFFANRNGAGYDFYSFYAEAHRLGCLKTLVVGRYRAAFGMGLVMGNSFSVGKLSVLSSLGKQAYGLKAHTSRSAARYLQGAAATVEVAKGVEVSAYASWRKLDATLNDEGAIATIRTDGYHRTLTEMDKKNNASQTAAGAHVGYRTGGFRLGATAAYTAYDRSLQPDTAQRYRRYNASGKDFWNVGVDYGYTGHLFTVHGETATGGCGAFATINMVSFTPSSELTLTGLYRFYGMKYHAQHAQSLSEGSRVQNESGAYLGVLWQPVRYLRLTAYSDYAYFPAPTFQARVASHAWDNLLQAQYDKGKCSLTARYRIKMREEDNDAGDALVTHTTHRARLGGSYKSGAWRLGAQTDWVFSKMEENSMGWMLTANAGYSYRWLRLTGSVGYFDTDDYDSRVYGYEQGVLYSYAFRSYSGEGIHGSIAARADVGPLMFIAHLSYTNYFDRDQISSGWQQINRSSKTDLELQVRWRF